MIEKNCATCNDLIFDGNVFLISNEIICVSCESIFNNGDKKKAKIRINNIIKHTKNINNFI